MEQQKNAEVEYKARDELLLSQQETIRLLQQLKDENDYLRRAREIALGILQGTVYRMVNNIDSCKSEAIEGLKARIESLEKSQQPFQDMIKTLKASISQSSKVTQMEQAHNANLKRCVLFDMSMFRGALKITSFALRRDLNNNVPLQSFSMCAKMSLKLLPHLRHLRSKLHRSSMANIY